MNPRLAWVVLPVLGLAAGALFAAPAIVHTLDGGSARGTVRQVVDGSLPSRNVTLTVLASVNRGLKETVTEKGKSPKVSFYLPVKDPDAPDGPTELVYFSSGNEVFDAAERPDEPIEIEGVVRDVLWEGLSSSVKKDLVELHPVADKVKLIERALGFDRLVAIGAPLAGLLVGLFLASSQQKRA